MNDLKWTPLQWTHAADLVNKPVGLVPGEVLLGVAENNLYYVWVYRWAGPHEVDWVHLSIRNHARSSVRRWRDLQRIKTEIVGAEAEAVELFPAESRLLDVSNQYHLWCPEHEMFPFGITTRAVTSDIDDLRRYVANAGSANQRPYDYDPDTYLHHVGLLESHGLLTHARKQTANTGDEDR